MEPWLKELLERRYDATALSGCLEAATTVGENYASCTQRIVITFQQADGNLFKKSFILKSMPKSEVSKQIMENYGCFESEINVYSNVLPRMEECSKGIPKPWCEYIGHYLNEAIVLEDLKGSGFRGCPRMKGLDLEHALLALRGLGIYHGLSVTLTKEDHPFPMMNLVQEKPEPKTFLKGAFQVCSEAVSTWGPKWAEVGEKLMKEKDQAFLKLRSLAEQTEKKFVVLNHGDCWTCNMMFSYHPDGSLNEIKLFDFQTPHWNSFGWDMHGVLACSVQPEVRRKNWELLVKTYSTALVDTMRSCGINRALIPSFEEVLEELERLKYHRFVCMVGMYPVCSGESGGYDPEKNVEGSNAPSVSTTLYGERYKIAVQDDLWDFHMDGTF